jgi:hypothetical protein
MGTLVCRETADKAAGKPPLSAFRSIWIEVALKTSILGTAYSINVIHIDRALL